MIDSDFLYLMAFSNELTKLSLKYIKKLQTFFIGNENTVSKFFFFLFRKFIEDEKKKKAKSEKKDFDLKKFESENFFKGLYFFSKLFLSVLIPKKE